MTVPLGDADAGVSSGPMRALFDAQQPAAFSPALSADGRYMTYRSLDLGRWSVRLLDSVTGKDIALVSATTSQFNPRISGNSARIAWADHSGNITSVMRTGGAVEQLCKACGTTMGISADGARISYEPATGEDLIYYDVPRKTSVKVADRPADTILTAGRFSPDGKWMAFHARARRSTAQIFVVRLDGPLPVPRDQWIAITAGDLEDMEPAWSPNGALLYFLSDRDGFRCIWARRLDPATHHPVGDPFEVAPFHTARASLRRLANTTGLTGLTVAPGRLVFALGELTGNIWLEERQ
jgi:Tol biopolymer transport system component